MQKIGDCLVDNGLGDVPVEIYRDCVCALGAAKLENNERLSVEKELPSSDAEKAEKFKAAVQPIIDGIENVSVKVTSALGVGDKYKTITALTNLTENTPVSLEHKEGEVWLIDFWATWCPPCQAPMAHNQSMLEKNGETWGK